MALLELLTLMKCGVKMKKVKDLIEQLQKLDPNAPIMCEYDGGYGGDLYLWKEINEETNQIEIVITPQGYNRNYDGEPIWTTEE